jgi:3-oxoacyl-[acyl-carrier-protein] synthase II
VREPFVVTGLGAVSAAGVGCYALWAAACAGEGRFAEISRFAHHGELAGVVPGFGEVRLVAGKNNVEAQGLCLEFAATAAREAMASAKLTGGARVGLVLGTNIVDRPQTYAQMVATLGEALHVAGPRIAVSTACASGTTALGVAFELLMLGCVEAVVVGGADALTPILLAGFRTLRMLAPERCAPFSTPVGTTLGEGAGFLIVETLGSARARGVKVGLALRGYGSAADAFHATRPDPRGEGLVRSMSAALRHAGVAAEEVAYVNVHGTGTEANDEAECRGLARVFGGRAGEVPMSASKSLLGHAQGAAGALEAVLMLLARERGVVPPTLQFVGARAGCGLDMVGEGRPRAVGGDVVAKYSAGFGGSNAAVVFASAERAVASRMARPVALVGVATADGATGDGEERVAGDPLTRALTGAARAALRAAGIGEAGEDVGLCVAQRQVSPESYERLLEVIERRGLDRLSTHALARTLLGAPAGACCEALDLRGPLCVVAADGTGVVLAVVLAAQQLMQREEGRCVLAASAAELDGAAQAECVALVAGTGAVMLRGWGLAAGGCVKEAEADALARAGVREAPRFVELGVLLAALRAGEVAAGVWVAEDPRGVACAAVLGSG